MKKRYNILLACSLILALTSCGPSKEEAINYNDQIISEQKMIADKINILNNSLTQDAPGLMDEAYRQVLIQLDSGTVNVAKMGDFDGKTDFREASLKLFAVYKSVLQGEFKTMIDILKNSGAEIPPQAKDQFLSIREQASKKIENGLKEFRRAQDEFADKYGLVLDNTSGVN